MRLTRLLALGAIVTASLGVAIGQASPILPSGEIVALATPKPPTPAPLMPVTAPPLGSDCSPTSGRSVAISPCSGGPETVINIYILHSLSGKPSALYFTDSKGNNVYTLLSGGPNPLTAMPPKNYCKAFFPFGGNAGTFKVMLGVGMSETDVGQFSLTCPAPVVTVTPVPNPPSGGQGCSTPTDAMAAISPCIGPAGTTINVFPLKGLDSAPATLYFAPSTGGNVRMNATVSSSASAYSATVANYCPYTETYDVSLSTKTLSAGKIGKFTLVCPQGTAPPPTPTPTPKPSAPQPAGAAPACNDKDTPLRFTPCSAKPGQTLALTQLPKAGVGAVFYELLFYPPFDASVNPGPGVPLSQTGPYAFTAVVPNWLCNQYNVGKSYNASLDVVTGAQQYMGSLGISCATPAPPPPPTPGPSRTATPIPPSAQAPGTTCTPADLNWATPCAARPGDWVRVPRGANDWIRFGYLDPGPYGGVPRGERNLYYQYSGMSSGPIQNTLWVVQIPSDVCSVGSRLWWFQTSVIDWMNGQDTAFKTAC